MNSYVGYQLCRIIIMNASAVATDKSNKQTALYLHIINNYKS